MSKCGVQFATTPLAMAMRQLRADSLVVPTRMHLRFNVSVAAVIASPSGWTTWHARTLRLRFPSADSTAGVSTTVGTTKTLGCAARAALRLHCTWLAQRPCDSRPAGTTAVVALKFSMRRYGAPFVMMGLAMVMPASHAVSLAVRLTMREMLNGLGVAMVQSGWTTWPAQVTRLPCHFADSAAGVSTTAGTTKTWECAARVAQGRGVRRSRRFARALVTTRRAAWLLCIPRLGCTRTRHTAS